MAPARTWFLEVLAFAVGGLLYWRHALSPRSGGGGHGRRPCSGRGRNRPWRDRLRRTSQSWYATPTTWTYGTSAAAHNIGKLASLSKPDAGTAYTENYTFDSIGRPQQSTYTEDGTAYNINYTYNTLGAVDTVQYPTSSSGYRFTLKYLYSYGYVQQVKRTQLPHIMCIHLRGCLLARDLCGTEITIFR